MKTISVKIPDALAHWLERRAGELRQSRSQIVRDALERFQSGNSGESCHDLMGDVCGSIKGPKDLSTHPKHLKGFGE